MNYHKYTTEELIDQKGNIEKLKDAPHNEVYLILDNVRSMYNVGAIFRTADAARIKMLYLCGITASPPRKEIEKTALKTIDHVPWQYHKNAEDVIKELTSQGITVIALEQCRESINYLDFDYKKPIAIVLGHEIYGVSESVLSLCHNSISIPMHGIANSLNISTAAGIILFKAIED